jgi:hypothetical protein
MPHRSAAWTDGIDVSHARDCGKRLLRCALEQWDRSDIGATLRENPP